MGKGRRVLSCGIWDNIGRRKSFSPNGENDNDECDGIKGETLEPSNQGLETIDTK